MKIFKLFVGFWGVNVVKDTQCGFKMLSRSAAQRIVPNIHLDRWIFDVELIYLAERLGVPIAEVPINWTEIPGSKLSLTTDSFNMALDLLFMRTAYCLGIWKIHA